MKVPSHLSLVTLIQLMLRLPHQLDNLNRNGYLFHRFYFLLLFLFSTVNM
jgi:hypothetical protein